MKAKAARLLIRAAFDMPDPPEEEITHWADRFGEVGLPVGLQFDADLVIVMLSVYGKPKMGMSCGRSVTFGREIPEIVKEWGATVGTQLDEWAWMCVPSLRKGEHHAIPLRNPKDARWRGFRPNHKGLLTVEQVRSNAKLPVFPPLDVPRALPQ